MSEASNEDLMADLKRQILELAIASDNPQFKLDAFKAVVERGKAAKPVEAPPVDDAMTIFQRSVKRAENGAESAKKPG